MRTLGSILKEITQLTSNIETNYPELYQFLDENPITLSHGEDYLDTEAFSSYLESLKQQLKHYIQDHPAGKKKEVTP